MKLKDQARAVALIDGDAELADLTHLRAPYLDLEVREAATSGGASFS
jgi:hypothetical protein